MLRPRQIGLHQKSKKLEATRHPRQSQKPQSPETGEVQMAASPQKRQDSLFEETTDHDDQVQPIPPHGGAAAKKEALLVEKSLQDQLEAVEDEEAIVS
mmetsp:Transcript_9441/g.13172  ORF Transcript_9441/g.13172 Transcript_9441/m.13172 type:complete len:98 (-) Transcript_9441:154-447(-)